MKYTRIFFAVFHANSGDSSGSPRGSVVSGFQNAVKRQQWPYDNGDDPAFYAMRRFGGQLSWGVCRSDVRNRLSPGDIVVFFSSQKREETGDSEFRLCALATVERGVKQTDLWDKKDLRKYTKYFNTLIRPSRSRRDAWEHFEPALKGPGLHKDWLWRIAEHRGLDKSEFEKIEASDLFDSGTMVHGHSLRIADNYILFSGDAEKSHVLTKPPVVAEHFRGKPAEEWKPDKFSQAIRAITLYSAAQAKRGQSSLQARNSQLAHLQVVFELPQHEAEAWRAEFLELIRGR